MLLLQTYYFLETKGSLFIISKQSKQYVAIIGDKYSSLLYVLFSLDCFSWCFSPAPELTVLGYPRCDIQQDLLHGLVCCSCSAFGHWTSLIPGSCSWKNILVKRIIIIHGPHYKWWADYLLFIWSNWKSFKITILDSSQAELPSLCCGGSRTALGM